MGESHMKIALLGTGDISQEFMAAIQKTGCATVTAVYNRHGDHARDFAARYGLDGWYDDYDRLLEQDACDTVYVGLPNGLHHGYALRALASHRHVIIEKPFAANMDQFADLVAAAQANGVYLMEMDRVLAQPNFAVIRDHLADIGPVRLVSLNFCKYSRKYDALLAGQVGNVFTTAMAGGALYDLGVYGLHLATGLFGMPMAVTYRADRYRGGVDLTGCLIMEYDGFMCVLMQSKNSLGEMHTVIQGEKGTLMSNSPASVLQDVELWQGRQRSSIGAPVDLFGTAYTLQAIADIVSRHDDDAYRRRLEHSRQVMNLLCQARASAGIVFEADSH